MPYCITLRSRTDERITGWYAGSRTCRWSTDHNRRRRFDNPYEASAVCQELRHQCPHNAAVINAVINIEVTGDDRQLSVVLPKSRVSA